MLHAIPTGVIYVWLSWGTPKSMQLKVRCPKENAPRIYCGIKDYCLKAFKALQHKRAVENFFLPNCPLSGSSCFIWVSIPRPICKGIPGELYSWEKMQVSNHTPQQLTEISKANLLKGITSKCLEFCLWKRQAAGMSANICVLSVLKNLLCKPTWFMGKRKILLED